VASFTPLQPTLALRMVILGLFAAVRPWKPISLSSQRKVIVLTLLQEAVWTSVVSVATEGILSLRTRRFCTQWYHSVSLCGLSLRG
jgi:archaellum biogenesis ATPase FlaH